jgi:hypothetical protein
MESLPKLQGTQPQVQWAEKIRLDALTVIPPADVARIAKVHDSTWWIANRYALKQGNFQEPAEYQMIVGEPAPEASAPAQGFAGDVPESFTRGLEQAEMMEQELKEQPDAIQFARSVSQIPELAEITILALMGRAYKTKLAGELTRRAQEKLKAFNSDFATKTNRDVKAVNLLLGRKQ